MGTLKWYKRDPNAALTGMMELTPTERGLYNTILDLIYTHDGEMIDDETKILPWMNCRARVWRKVRARLLSLGKLYVRDGCLRNERADAEVLQSKNRYLNAIRMNNKKWGTYREIKALQDRKGLLSTTTLRKNLSARIVPSLKVENEESGDK